MVYILTIAHYSYVHVQYKWCTYAFKIYHALLLRHVFYSDFRRCKIQKTAALPVDSVKLIYSRRSHERIH